MTLLFALFTVAFASDCGSQLTRFHVVRPRAVATFQWDRDKARPGAAHDFIVGYPFEMQSTPATRVQWAYVMGESMPDRPEQAVHHESCAAIAAFFERLNELAHTDDPWMSQLFEGHRVGDVYRLPTEREWALVAMHALAETKARNGSVELDDHAWHAGSGVRKAIQDVGRKEPLYLAGLPFYDLFGNVEELTSDAYTDRMGDPEPHASAHQVARGGSVKTKGSVEDFCLRRNRIYWREDSTVHDHFLGFRIVREYPAHHDDHVPFIRW